MLPVVVEAALVDGFSAYNYIDNRVERKSSLNYFTNE